MSNGPGDIVISTLVGIRIDNDRVHRHVVCVWLKTAKNLLYTCLGRRSLDFRRFSLYLYGRL